MRVIALDDGNRLVAAHRDALLNDWSGVSVSFATSLGAAVAGVDAAEADALLVVLRCGSHAATETLALLANSASELPVVALAYDSMGDDAAEAAGEFSDSLIAAAALDGSTLVHRVGVAIDLALANRRAAQVNARFRRLFDNSIAGMFAMSADGEMQTGNPALLDMLGLGSGDELHGRAFVDEICADAAIGHELLRMVARDGVVDNAEVVLTGSAGQPLTVLLSAVGVVGRDGEVESVEGTMIDITARKRAQEELTYLAKFDRLTGLANRYLLKEVLSKAIARALRRQRTVALLMLDLDRFKEVNDAMGHDAGDALLRTVGSRLNACVREGDTVARLGGDEFAVLIESIGDAAVEAGAVARKITRTLGAPYTLGGREVLAPPSVGIATCPGSGMHAEGLLKAADIAMYRAKGEGGGRFVFYSDELHDEVMARMALEHDVRIAADRREFTLVYQPKIALDDGRIVELEALLRWPSRRNPTVGPAVFVPVLESLGLIADVGGWVIGMALNELATLQRSSGLPGLGMSLNLSVRQLAQPERLLEVVARALRKSGVEPGCVEFEVTESTLMHDAERGIQTLNALRGLGVRIAIDDFGTGFSSLQYLKALPIHGLKIDRTFIRDLPDSVNDAAIVRATLAMATSLGLTVTAEGVERADQAAFLRAEGCALAQGYYFSRPRPAAALPELLRMDAALLPGHAKTQLDDPPVAADTALRQRGAEPEATARMRRPFANATRSRH